MASKFGKRVRLAGGCTVVSSCDENIGAPLGFETTYPYPLKRHGSMRCTPTTESIRGQDGGRQSYEQHYAAFSAGVPGIVSRLPVVLTATFRGREDVHVCRVR